MGSESGRVISVNVGRPREFEWLGRIVTSSIWKSPVEGRVALVGVNFVGDDQSDRLVHGGPEKAVYSYAREDEEWWEGELGRPLAAGAFGENLTLRGVDVTGALIGERWEIGSAVLEVAQPRFPCWKLGARMGDPDFVDVFRVAGRPGAYLRIVQEGEVGEGDEVHVAHRPAHGVTIAQVTDIYGLDRGNAALLLDVPELAAGIKRWARKRVEHAQR